MDLDVESGVRNARKIIQYAIEQSKLLKNNFKNDAFQLIIGGDCSILIGNSLALKQSGKYGLFFIDGHTDFVMPKNSETGGAAGMDLAIVTGHGHDKLTNIQSCKPYFEENHVFCVGNREYEKSYVNPILNSKINYYDLNSLRKNGLRKIINQFLLHVDKNNLDGFLIHFDVDVLCDEIMPAVDSRNKGGLSYEELQNLLEPLMANKKAVGLEITILDPTLDKKGIYTKNFVDNMLQILENARRYS